MDQSSVDREVGDPVQVSWNTGCAAGLGNELGCAVRSALQRFQVGANRQEGDLEQPVTPDLVEQLLAASRPLRRRSGTELGPLTLADFLCAWSEHYHPAPAQGWRRRLDGPSPHRYVAQGGAGPLVVLFGYPIVFREE